MYNHIAFCINNSYAPYVGVAIKSIWENNKDGRFVIHILTDFLSEDSIIFLKSQCRTMPLQIHKVDDSRLKNLKKTWSIYTWYRLLLPSILTNIDKILYLDADVLITGPISSLFDLNMTGKAVAGVIDIQAFNNEAKKRLGGEIAHRYICAGVLLMNLVYWRANDLTDKICDWAIINDKKIAFPDQDAINAVCKDSRIVLPMKFGVLDAHFHYAWRFSEYLRQEALEALDNPIIVHYAGQSPWIYERMYHQFQHLWDECNSRLENPVKKIHHKERNRSLKLMLRHFLDRIKIMKLPRWYATKNLSDEELRYWITHGNLISGT